MNIKEIINKKRFCQCLSKEEIDYVIENFVNDKIADYQMSSLLMAITINGMNFEETLNLTDAMLRSGDRLDLSSIHDVVVDKHSTGGIGDKVTIVLAPILAALDINVAKMSGRGLGYTGGTIDKLESIPNFNVNLKETDFVNQVNDIHLALTSSNLNLDPADKKIYALRDVTATVSSIPLIASSIMSKKLASNADLIALDVKVGNGALITNLKEARMLANYLIKIGNHYNKKVICLLTNMNQPLGYTIGNKLEIMESMRALNDDGATDLMQVVYTLASIIVSEVKKIDVKQAFELCRESVINGKAYLKFLQFINRQGGNVNDLKSTAKKVDITSLKTGYVNFISALDIGKITLELGAGRLNKNDNIDYEVGIHLRKKVGDFVNKGETLATVYYNEKEVDEKTVRECFEISLEKKDAEPIIYKLLKM